MFRILAILSRKNIGLLTQNTKALNNKSLNVTIRFQKFQFETAKTNFHTSGRRCANPLLLLLLKTKGVKALKLVSIIFGRQFRKLHDKLPKSVQRQLSRHRIAFSVLSFCGIYIVYYSYTHYDNNSLTGRVRWISFTEDQITILADADAKKIKEEYHEKFLPHNSFIYKSCNEIVGSIVSTNQDIDKVKEKNWKLFVIDEPSCRNAFVLPNGEIYVFTGILKMMNTWPELAVVLGHEMSHAILGHAQEQQSYLHFSEILMVPLLAFIWFTFDDFAAFITYSIQQFLYPLVFDLGFQKPYSRQLETEADEFGLKLSSKACYDPRWSVLLWQKFAMKEIAEDKTGIDASVAEYLSTHPSSEGRSRNLEELLPEMMKIREQSKCGGLDKTDPVCVARTLRECCQIMKEKRDLLQEIEADNRSYNSKEVPNDKKIDLKSRLNKNSYKLEELDKKFNRILLQSEYDSIKRDEIKLQKSYQKSFWNKILSDVAVKGHLTGTLFEKRNEKLQTAGVGVLPPKL